MKNLILILFSLLVLSCRNNSKRIDKSIIQIEEDSVGLSQIVFPEYLTADEKEDIILNWRKSLNNKSDLIGKYNKIVISRKQEITLLKENTTPYKNTRIPFNFKRFLMPEELDKFNSDSILHWISYGELVKTRQERLKKLIKNKHYLNDAELQSFIRDGMQNADSVNKMVDRKHQDRTNSFKKRQDSLRNIIFPVDSDLPFGSPVLLKKLNSGIKSFEFSKDVNTQLTDVNSIKTRKTIYNIWEYYAKIVRNVPDIDPYGYLPSIEHNEFLSLNKGQNEDFEHLFHEETEYFDTYSEFDLRLGDVSIYEVYLSFSNPNFSCGFRKLEDCCFNRSGCNTSGYLTFYNRESETAKTINAIYLMGNAFRFFTIEKNGIIKLFEGRGINDKISFDGQKKTGTLFFEAYLTHTIQVLDNGEIQIDKDVVTKEYGY